MKRRRWKPRSQRKARQRERKCREARALLLEHERLTRCQRELAAARAALLVTLYRRVLVLVLEERDAMGLKLAALLAGDNRSHRRGVA